MSSDDSHDPQRVPQGGLRILAVIAALLVVVVLASRTFPKHDAVGREAPDFHVTVVANGADLGVHGSSVSLRDLRGRAVLLVFWATWCGPCRAEAPVVDETARVWRDRNVVVLGISTDAPGQGDPGQFAEDRRLTYPIVQDVYGEAVRAYQIDTLPTLVLVSRDGKMLAQQTGGADREELDQLIRQAL